MQPGGAERFQCEVEGLSASNIFPNTMVTLSSMPAGDCADDISRYVGIWSNYVMLLPNMFIPSKE